MEKDKGKKKNLNQRKKGFLSPADPARNTAHFKTRYPLHVTSAVS